MAHMESELRERRTIEDMLSAKSAVDKTTAEIGGQRSTVFGEIKLSRSVDDVLPKLNGSYGRSAVERRARRRKLVRLVGPSLSATQLLLTVGSISVIGASSSQGSDKPLIKQL